MNLTRRQFVTAISGIAGAWVGAYRGASAAAWRRGADAPTPRSEVAAAVLGGRIYVVGGEAPEGTFAQVEIFDPAANRWTRGPDLPTTRHGLGVVEHQGRLYVLAGGPTPGGSASAAVEILEP